MYIICNFVCTCIYLRWFPFNYRCQTPIKRSSAPRLRSPVCQVRLNTEKVLEGHVLACVRKGSAKEEFLCDICSYATSKKKSNEAPEKKTSNIVVNTRGYRQWMGEPNTETMSDVLGEPSRAKASKTKTFLMASTSLIQCKLVRKTPPPLSVANSSR